MIQFADILNESVVDGPGVRLVVFLQGCPRHCQACHNESLLSSAGGQAVEEKALANLILEKLTPLHAGVTFSGGDPLMQAQALFSVINILKEHRTELNIWVYTGYLYEEVKNLPVMKLIDVLVDGPFILGRKKLNLAFRGSDNQRIIDIQRTAKTGAVTELVLDQLLIAG